jgi:hypothetical protein
MSLRLAPDYGMVKAALGIPCGGVELSLESGATVATARESTPEPPPGKEPRMADPRENAADVPAIAREASLGILGPDWDTEDAYWQSAYPERPYARADRSYEYYRAAYRYGTEHATLWPGREWADAESDLRAGWATTDDPARPSWDEMQDAIRDAWDHVRGRSTDDRTHIR